MFQENVNSLFECGAGPKAPRQSLQTLPFLYVLVLYCARRTIPFLNILGGSGVEGFSFEAGLSGSKL